jgi:hypothetical protein
MDVVCAVRFPWRWPASQRFSTCAARAVFRAAPWLTRDPPCSALENGALTGGIPALLANLTSLVYLELGNNQLSGPIPPELGSLSSLGTLCVPAPAAVLCG